MVFAFFILHPSASQTQIVPPNFSSFFGTSSGALRVLSACPFAPFLLLLLLRTCFLLDTTVHISTLANLVRPSISRGDDVQL